MANHDSSKSKMKTQITSILLCALLSSTLAHEYLSARRFAHEARSSKYLSHFQTRDASRDQQCAWICEYPSSNSSTTYGIIGNETTGLFAVVNENAKVAIVIDINANIVALFNGTSGAIIVINIGTGSGAYIEGGQFCWISAKESFVLHFSKLTSLQKIHDSKEGKKFDASSISSVILEALGNLLGHLSAQLKLEIQGNIKGALTILLKISSSLVSLLKGPLKGILKLVGNTLIAIHGDLLWLVSVLEGLGEFLEAVTGGLAALLKAEVELDLALLLGTANGIDLLVNLLLAIVARLDLSIVGDLLNSVEKLLGVIVKLGGNVSGGVTGLLKVVAQIIALIGGHLELDALIHTLLEFAASKSGEIDISISLEGLLNVIKIQESNHSSGKLEGLTSLVNNLLNGKLVIGGINISEIIEILLKGAVGGVLELVVSVLLALTSVIKAVVSIPTLLLHLLQLLQSAVGLHLVQEVIPDLSIDVNISLSGNIIEQILSKVNVETIISLLAKGGGIEGVLKALPVIGPIVDALSKAVSGASKGSLSLSVILKDSGAKDLVAKITVWIKSSLKIPGSVTLPPITLPTIGGIFGSHGGSKGSTKGSTTESGRHWSISWGLKEHHGSHPAHEKSGLVHGHHNNQERKHHKEH